MHASYVSLVAAVTEEGAAVERQATPTVKKMVANLKMATDNTNMAAAFWDGHAEKMGSARAGQVYRLDWVLLKQEAVGRYSISSSLLLQLTLKKATWQRQFKTAWQILLK